MKRYLVLRDEDLMISELAAATKEIQPPPMPGEAAPSAEPHPGGLKSLVRSLKDQAEEEAIRRTLDQTSWNRKNAAVMLNISYKALLYKIRQYGIEAPSPPKTRPVKPGLM